MMIWTVRRMHLFRVLPKYAVYSCLSVIILYMFLFFNMETLQEQKVTYPKPMKRQYPNMVMKSSAPHSPIITLFTTMKLSNQRSVINNNTLRLWPTMKQWATVVLFTTPSDDPKWTKIAQNLGWVVYPAPSIRVGLPVIKDMFMFLLKKNLNTPYLGYANSDILFTEDLLETLSYLHGLNVDTPAGVLFSGQRINAIAEEIAKYSTISSIKSNEVISPEAKRASMFTQDYFITMTSPERQFPWHRVPDLVVGKPGYDNWLIIKGIEWETIMIDLSQTVTVLHQRQVNQNDDIGWTSKNVCANRDLFDPFSLANGRLDCVPYFTMRVLDGIYVHSRTDFVYDCMPEMWSNSRKVTCESIVREHNRLQKMGISPHQ